MDNQPKNQHDIPATYLRRFAHRKNHVWCLFKTDYIGWKVEEKSVKAKFFTHEHLYTLENSDEPYALEDLFNLDLENNYFKTIKKIIDNEQIEPEEYGFLSLWMYISKWRSSNVKNDWTEFIKKHLRHRLALTRNLNAESENHLEEYVKAMMKGFYPRVMTDNETITKFCDLMAGKSWLVIRAPEHVSFMTNDNPGYSFNIKDGDIDSRTFNYNFTINPDSVNIYPITSKHCLQIMPIAYNPEDEIDSSLKLYYRDASLETVEEINNKTISFSKRYLISNLKSDLERVRSSM